MGIKNIIPDGRTVVHVHATKLFPIWGLHYAPNSSIVLIVETFDLRDIIVAIEPPSLHRAPFTRHEKTAWNPFRVKKGAMGRAKMVSILAPENARSGFISDNSCFETSTRCVPQLYRVVFRGSETTCEQRVWLTGVPIHRKSHFMMHARCWLGVCGHVSFPNVDHVVTVACGSQGCAITIPFDISRGRIGMFHALYGFP